MLSMQITRTVYIAEGAIAHLFKELPSFQIRVIRELALAGILLGNNLSQVLVDSSALGTIGLSWLGVLGGGVACLCRAVLLIVGSFRVRCQVLLVASGLAIHRSRCHVLLGRRLCYGLGRGFMFARLFVEVGGTCLLA